MRIIYRRGDWSIRHDLSGYGVWFRESFVHRIAVFEIKSTIAELEAESST
jgi:hypothetical protein